MNPLTELALVLAMFAALVALSYGMRRMHNRRPVAAVVVEDEPAAELSPFASAVMVGSPAFYDDPDEEE